MLNTPNSYNRNSWIDYLRSTITILVVAHHSSLAYTTFARFDETTYINSTHAIVDIQRFRGLDIFQNFNDVFFMSLMFLIGGLFLSKSIEKKGVLNFFRDRVYRLLIPFFFLGTFFMLLAYFPSFYVTSKKLDVITYIIDFFDHQKWPAGPPWFIGILFLFNMLFIPFHIRSKKYYHNTIEIINSFGNKPSRFICVLFVLTWILYVPMAFYVGAGTWIGYGPLDFQLSRILWYYGYFTVGVMIGNSNFNEGIFSLKSALVRKWKTWISLAIIVYTVLILIEEPLRGMVGDNQLKEVNALLIYFTIYTASCVFSNIAFLTTFRKLMNVEISALSFLKDNSYLIYLIHYIFVIWFQYLLLDVNATAFIKFSLTFLCALICSLIVAILLRKIKLIKKYI